MNLLEMIDHIINRTCLEIRVSTIEGVALVLKVSLRNYVFYNLKWITLDNIYITLINELEMVGSKGLTGGE